MLHESGLRLRAVLFRNGLNKGTTGNVSFPRNVVRTNVAESIRKQVSFYRDHLFGGGDRGAVLGGGVVRNSRGGGTATPPVRRGRSTTVETPAPGASASSSSAGRGASSHGGSAASCSPLSSPSGRKLSFITTLGTSRRAARHRPIGQEWFSPVSSPLAGASITPNFYHSKGRGRGGAASSTSSTSTAGGGGPARRGGKLLCGTNRRMIRPGNSLHRTVQKIPWDHFAGGGASCSERGPPVCERGPVETTTLEQEQIMYQEQIPSGLLRPQASYNGSGPPLGSSPARSYHHRLYATTINPSISPNVVSAPNVDVLPSSREDGGGSSWSDQPIPLSSSRRHHRSDSPHESRRTRPPAPPDEEHPRPHAHDMIPPTDFSATASLENFLLENFKSTRRTIRALWQLSKGKLTVWVCFSALPGYFIAAPELAFSGVAALFVGTGLCSAASQTANQIIEQDRDRLMKRTQNRPLVTGSITDSQAWMLHGGFLGTGFFLLTSQFNIVTGLVAAATWLCYIGAYTTLKPRSKYNTHVGAIAGSLPTCLGFAAALPWDHGSILLSLSLIPTNPWLPHCLYFFGLQTLWQMPHFYSLAWLCREDYKRAGYKMFCIHDDTGKEAVELMAKYMVCLLAYPALGYWYFGLTSSMFVLDGTLATLIWSWYFWKFKKTPSKQHCRRFFLASVGYLLAMIVFFSVHARARDGEMEPIWRIQAKEWLAQNVCVHESSWCGVGAGETEKENSWNFGRYCPATLLEAFGAGGSAKTDVVPPTRTPLIHNPALELEGEGPQAYWGTKDPKRGC